MVPTHSLGREGRGRSGAAQSGCQRKGLIEFGVRWTQSLDLFRFMEQGVVVKADVVAVRFRKKSFKSRQNHS